ncbi:hypothetical protein MACH21_01990 [Roseicyclus marinus]|uniref:Uncharacterized protein n=1 Tax=Roseicyclus marinus TaxID=2161673 RepID=A0AA48H5F8_9RHOB|nr:hypothetical protein MACH21_01990 [Roseicyclus marinus]
MSLSPSIRAGLSPATCALRASQWAMFMDLSPLFRRDVPLQGARLQGGAGRARAGRLGWGRARKEKVRPCPMIS